MDIQPHGFPRVGRQVENSCVHPDGVLGADLHTISAIDTDPKVDVETNRVLLDVGIRMLTGHYRDALGRANRFAEHAPDAAGRVIVPEREPGRLRYLDMRGLSSSGY